MSDFLRPPAPPDIPGRPWDPNDDDEESFNGGCDIW